MSGIDFYSIRQIDSRPEAWENNNTHIKDGPPILNWAKI